MSIIRNLSIESYHADSHAVSKSQLDDLDRSPEIFWNLHRNPNRPARTKPTAAMSIGTMAHCAILEPRHFDSRYVVGPDVDKRTKEWKDFAASVVLGETIITQAEKDQVFAMADSLRTIPFLRDCFASGEAEVSAYWTDPATGVQCRCRPDFVHAEDDNVIIVDVKSTVDASPEGFAKAVVNWKYAKQAGFYSDGFAAASGKHVSAFAFAAVEKTWPYAAAAYVLTGEGLEWGRNQYRANLHTYAECMKTNVWPGYTKGLQPLILPAWATREHEEIEIGYAE